MIPELKANIGDFYIDCARMPSADDLKGKEAEVKSGLEFGVYLGKAISLPKYSAATQ